MDSSSQIDLLTKPLNKQFNSLGNYYGTPGIVDDDA
jgi:hypothetical protein